MRKRLMILGNALLFGFILVSSNVKAQSSDPLCATTAQLKPWQLERLQTVEIGLNEALAKGDAKQVESLLREQRLVLGVEVGYPAFVSKLYPLPTRMRWLTLAQTVEQAQRTVEKYPELFNHLGKLARGFPPATQSKPTASPVIAADYGLALLKLANLSTDDQSRTRLLNLGLHTLDTLLELRQGGGLFPFLDLRGQFIQPHALLARYYGPIPNDTVSLQPKGWLTYDYGSGVSYAVNGPLLATMCKAYQATNFPAYKTAAERMAVQLLNKPPVASVRHSAALVYGLATAGQVLADDDYWKRALSIAELLILPAQLPSGGWPDSLDASLDAQVVILKGLLALYTALPQTHKAKQRVWKATLLTSRNLLHTSHKCGGALADVCWVFELQTHELPAGMQDSLRTLTGKIWQAQQPWAEDIPMLASYADMVQKTKLKPEQLESAEPTNTLPSAGTTALEQFPITPSPFSDYTLISFELAEAGAVRLEVRNAKGKIVATLLDEHKEPGMYHIRWDSRAESPGTYLFQLTIKGRGYLRRAQLVR